jgi:hypothetical protein
MTNPLECRDTKCCEANRKHHAVFHTPPGESRIGGSYGPEKPGWVMIQNVALEYRGCFWLVNVTHCPFCGAPLDKPEQVGG